MAPPISLRVLVVDDDHDVTEALTELVRMLGHACEGAYDGETAIELAREAPPDLVLCDLSLPGLDGCDVARTLRAEPRTARTRLIALTGFSDPSAVADAIAAGFHAHVTKPLSLDSLEALLAKEAARASA
ncbi:MAG: response regulator [Deltaproteobacteria bacterium]|nr:response regulator [Deltaproteobacteria bacterium]